MSMKSTRALILSHIMVFAAGVVVGKSLDADELSTYRELHENYFSKWKRRVSAGAIGLVSVAAVVVVVRAVHRYK